MAGFELEFTLNKLYSYAKLDLNSSLSRILSELEFKDDYSYGLIICDWIKSNADLTTDKKLKQKAWTIQEKKIPIDRQKDSIGTHEKAFHQNIAIVMTIFPPSRRPNFLFWKLWLKWLTINH